VPPGPASGSASASGRGSLSGSGAGSVSGDPVLDPLWRALSGYRLLALVFAVGLVWTDHGDYRRPALGLAVAAVLVVWTALATWVYLRPGAARGRFAVADLALTLAGVLATLVVQTPAEYTGGAPVLTTVWSAGPALALALAYGARAGVVAALLVQAAVVVVRGRLGVVELTDLLLMVAAAAAVGYAAAVLRASVQRMRRAAELRAALAERERLARGIHDGVLQVLAQVRRRGAELGGPAAGLGELAGEQEVALRTMISTGPPVDRPAGQADLAARLAELAAPRVSVSVPPSPVVLDSHTAAEVVAAVRAVLDNVQRHAGPSARAWVLVEDLGERVVVTARDDGPGIPDGRLAEAGAQGRLGVAQSIVGRIEAVGGTARCVNEPGLGCEWTLELPAGAR
jgi:signal transduction histidine kinase